ncbi:carbohydrate ABC transporter permease [Bifidobacterium stellenboschense]|uniref:ABC transporter, permease protein, probably raffinose/stachyose transporter n=1 Tax=Bifidobacterium stellenboschense TaxID=762211 RepID=A0A087DBR2_9BIFI|nr:sugar ABC transporter permease [Bifidobacterium stellenboschense]KFI92962.1 ABC transporter, permease protein, probably raffinose/stachyose transporter [Bifidobacterium stellenboschense]
MSRHDQSQEVPAGAPSAGAPDAKTPWYKTGKFAESAASTGFLFPIIVVFLVLSAVPLVQTIYYSFTDFNGFQAHPNFVGLQNYQKVFTDPSLLVGLGFTVLFAVLTTLITTVLAIPLAVALNSKFYGRSFARSLFFFLGVPSLIVLGLVWQYILSPLKTGALNSVLISMGLKSVPWLSDSNLARGAVIFVAIWAAVGWHATLYLAYLQAVPKDLYEQASVDGANGFQQFIHITLPQLVPGIVVSTFLLITNGLKVYDLPFGMTKGGPGYATNTITQAIIVQGISQSQYGLGSALAVLFTIACMIVVLGQQLLTGIITRRFA